MVTKLFCPDNGSNFLGYILLPQKLNRYFMFGMLMRPSAATEEEYEKIWQ